MVCIGEVKRHTGFVLNDGVSVKFGTVVSSDGLESEVVPTNQLHDTRIGFFFGPTPQFADEDVAGLALYQGYDTVVIAATHHRIDLPMTLDTTRLDRRWTLIDHSLAGEPAPGIVGVMPLSTQLG